MKSNKVAIIAAISIATLLTACGKSDVVETAPVKSSVEAAPAKQALKIAVFSGVNASPKLKFSDADCGYYSNIVANMQFHRNMGADTSASEDAIANMSPALQEEFKGIIANIWRSPENLWTKDQAAAQGREFCESHSRV